MSKYFKQIINQPANVAEADIESWAGEFYSFLAHIGLSASSFGKRVRLADVLDGKTDADDTNTQVTDRFDGDLTLEFSDEIKESPYQLIGRDELIDLIESNFPLTDELREALNSATPTEMRSIFSRIAETFASENRGYNDIMGALEQLLDRLTDSPIFPEKSLAGEYVDCEKKIILYTKVIESKECPFTSLNSMYLKVFVHEMFHAFHYLCGTKEEKNELPVRNDYVATIVKEALATAFEYAFCHQHKIVIIGTDVVSATPVTYPYAAARFLFDNEDAQNTLTETEKGGKLDVKQFRIVLGFSLSNMDMALKFLCTNHPELIEKYITKNQREIKCGF